MRAEEPAAGASHWLTAPDGLRLHYRVWKAPGGCARLLVVPGLGEHSGRYRQLAAELAPRGISVYALDLRGHGRSEGPRGHATRFGRLVADVEALLAVLPDPGLPLFLFGQSLGGLIVLRCLEAERVAPVRGAVLSAPALALSVEPPAWKRAMAAVLSRVLPALPLCNEIDPALLSHQPAAVEAYRMDPLVHDRITARLYVEMRRAMERAVAERDRVRVPLLVLVPAADRIVDPADSLALARALEGRAEARVYPGFYHEPLHETGRAEVVADLLRWLQAHGAGRDGADVALARSRSCP